MFYAFPFIYNSPEEFWIYSIVTIIPILLGVITSLFKNKMRRMKKEKWDIYNHYNELIEQELREMK